MKNGTIFLICVLLTVLAIPLFADLVLVNTVDEALSNSSINRKEVPFSEQEQFDMHIAVLAVGITAKKLNKMYDALQIYTESLKSGAVAFKKLTKAMGGVSRIKSGRH